MVPTIPNKLSLYSFMVTSTINTKGNKMKLIVLILMFMIFTVSAQAWTKFYNWQGDQQQVRCDSDRVSLAYFFHPMIDGKYYHSQEHYTTEDNIPVRQSVAIVEKYDKKKKLQNVNVNTLRVYEDRTDDADGNGYMTIFTLVLTNFNNNDSFKTSCTVWYKPKGTWDAKTIRLMENID